MTREQLIEQRNQLMRDFRELYSELSSAQKQAMLAEKARLDEQISHPAESKRHPMLILGSIVAAMLVVLILSPTM